MITRKWSTKLAAASVLAASLYATAAIAVGFGDITLRSALNEPLDAEISLTKTEGIGDGLLLVRLAPASAFAQAGISRDYYLTQLSFSVDTNADDKTVVKVRSQGPIVEPYLDFLVELEWPAGRILREYTLLLDLPIYTGEQTVAPSVKLADSGGKTSAKPASAANNTAKQKLVGDAHRVVVGDTLWNVSKRLRPRGSTILQTMDALYSQNANAFVGGDANKMKEGAILRLPSSDEINDEAGDVVASQIGLSEQKPEQVVQNQDAVSDEMSFDDGFQQTNDSDTATADDSSAGRLELASALDSNDDPAETVLANEAVVEAAAKAIGSNDVEQLSSELAVAQDEMNRAELENIELRERMALLEAQVDLMSELASAAENQAAIDAAAAKAAPEPLQKPSSLIEKLEGQPWYMWAGIGFFILLLLLFLRRSRADHNSDGDLEQPFGEEPLAEEGSQGYQDYDQEPRVNTGANLLVDDLDGLDLNPEDDLFDETDKEIFPEDDSEVSPEIFDSMVEAVAEAEVYLSLGNVDQAIEILEEARAADASDTGSRLKLMEIFFREGRRDELKAIHLEIEQTGDKVATDMASVILGPEEDVVSNIVEPSSQLDEQPADEPALNEKPVEAEQTEGVDEPSVAEATVDISDLLEDALESGDESAIDALDESVLSGDFLDDDFINGGIFSDEADPQAGESEEASVELPGESELKEGVNEGVSTDLGDFEGFDGDQDISAVDVKLDLANTYIEMGDSEGAREILEEIIGESDEEGQAKARAVLETL